MYLAANVALIVEWVKFRRRGIHKNVWLWVVTPVDRRHRAGHPDLGRPAAGPAQPVQLLPWLTIGLIAVGVIYALVLGAAPAARCSSGRPRCSRATRASPPTRCRLREERKAPGPKRGSGRTPGLGRFGAGGSVVRRAQGQGHGVGEDLLVDDVGEAEDERRRGLEIAVRWRGAGPGPGG